MSNGDGYRSPKSNVPNAPVRFAGVAPTTVTKGQLSDQVGNEIANKFRNTIERSLIAQKQVNLGVLETEVIKELNIGSAKASEQVTPEDVEAEFEKATGSAQAKIEHLSGTNRKTLQISLNRREGLLRAGQISPAVIGLKRAASEQKAQLFLHSEMSTVGRDSNVELLEEAVIGTSERNADRVAANLMTPTDAAIDLIKTTDKLGDAYFAGLFERGEYGTAIELLRSDPRVKQLSPAIAQRWMGAFVGKRSAITRTDIYNQMTDPGVDHTTNTWFSLEGETKLQKMRDQIPPILTEEDYRALTTARTRAMQSVGRARKPSALDDSFAQSIEAIEKSRAACVKDGNLDCKSRRDSVQPNDGNYLRLVQWSYIKDTEDENLRRAQIDQPPVEATLNLVNWVRKEGAIPPEPLAALVESIHLDQNPNDKQKELLHQQFKALRVLSNFAERDFFDLRDALIKNPRSKTVLDTFVLYNAHLYGTKGSRALDSANNPEPLMEPGIALDLALAELHEGDNTGQTRDKLLSRANKEEDDGMQAVEVVMLEAFNSVTGRNDTINDLPLGSRNRIKNRFVTNQTKGMNPDQAMNEAVRVEMVQKGLAPTSFNPNVEDKWGINSVDNPGFGNTTKVVLPSGQVIDLGSELYRSETILDIAHRLSFSIDKDRDPVRQAQAVALKEVLTELASDNTFLTGHAFIGHDRPPGSIAWARHPNYDEGRVIDFNKVQPKKQIVRAEEVNTLKYVMQRWADKSGMRLDEAYGYLNAVAFGNGATFDSENYWEPAMIGDHLTRTGKTARGTTHRPSWRVEAQFNDDTISPVQFSWHDTFTNLAPWRKSFGIDRAHGPTRAQTTGKHIAPMATVNGRIGGFKPISDLDGADSDFYLIPTVIDGEQLDDSAALDHAKKLGLENHINFGDEDQANSWLAQHEDFIREDGVLTRAVGPTGKRRNVVNPLLYDFDQYKNGMSMSEARLNLHERRKDALLQDEYMQRLDSLMTKGKMGGL